MTMPALQNAVERGSSVLFNVVSIGAILIGAVIYFARLDPAITELDHKVGDVKAAQTTTDLRIDHIEESRTIGLQRLSKAEEAIASIKDTLAKIDAKVDRLLTRNR